MPPSNGIVHTGSPDGSGDREHLVLEEMKAKVLVIDGNFLHGLKIRSTHAAQLRLG
jgi:hypothetical protein